MAEKIIVTLEAKTADAEKSIGSFKSQLRSAKEELLSISEKFGENSVQARKAAQAVAELQDAIGDANETAALFDPSKKFAALGNVVSSLAGGFTAFSGILALTGSEGKDVEQVMAKLQATMAITQGLSTIGQLKEEFSRLLLVVKSLGAGPISLIITGIGLLVTYFVSLKDSISDSIETTEEFTDELSNTSKTVFETQTKMDVLRERIKNAGKSFTEKQAILKTYNKEFGETLGVAKSVNQAESILIDKGADYIKILGLKAKAQAAFSVAAKEQEKHLQKQIEQENYILGLRESSKERGRAGDLDEFNHQIEYANKVFLEQESEHVKKIEKLNGIGADAEKQAADLSKTSKVNTEHEKTAVVKKESDNRNKIAEDAAKRLSENEEKAQQELNRIKQDNYLKNIDDDNRREAERIRLDYENKEREIRAQAIHENTKFALLTALREKQAFELQALEDKITKERNDRQAEATKQVELPGVGIDPKVKAIGDALAEFANLNKSQYDKDLENLEAWRKDRLSKVAGSAAAEAAVEGEYIELKNDLEDKAQAQRLKSISTTLSSAAGLFSQYSTAYKVLAIASTVIDTYQSATAAYKSLAGIPIYGPALGGVAAGIAVAAGLANAARIASVKIPGGGSVPPINASAPLIPQAQRTNTTLDAGSISQIGNAANSGTNRAYVLEYDINSGQERQARISRQARLGG